ncbi:MAG TPA: hypothetical protein VEZ11_06155, partial [Thermoanaerobaculia bacterium]|nr:hypothetical protein [Thermoanaerobaculia bacterium]
ALYTIELFPDSGSLDFRLARATLSYRSSKEGKMLTIEKTLRRSDLAPSWKAASERLQIASLAKAWSESLRGNGDASPDEVAAQARALAKRFPADPKASELADLAEISAKLP